jgi:hypothetical protein
MNFERKTWQTLRSFPALDREYVNTTCYSNKRPVNHGSLIDGKAERQSAIGMADNQFYRVIDTHEYRLDVSFVPPSNQMEEEGYRG